MVDAVPVALEQDIPEILPVIRQKVLAAKGRTLPVPWTVCNEAWLRETLAKVFQDRVHGSKFKQQLYEYATVYDEPELADDLLKVVGFEQAGRFSEISCCTASFLTTGPNSRK